MASLGILPSTSTQTLRSKSQRSLTTEGDSKENFQSFMDLTLQSQLSQQTYQRAMEHKRVSSRNEGSRASNTNRTKDDGQVQKSTTKEYKDTVVAEKKSEDSIGDDARTIALLQNMLLSLQEQLSEMLHVNESELMLDLQEQGLSMMDLLDSSVLTHYFLQASGAEDATVLLTDELLAQNLDQLLKLIPDEELQAITSKLQPIPSDSDAELITGNEGEYTLYSSELTMYDNEYQGKESSSENTSGQELLKSSKDESEQSKSSTEIRVDQMGFTVVDLAQDTTILDQITPTSYTREIVEQIVKEIKVSITPETASMSLMLTPESLGTIHLRVEMSDGLLTAHIVTETKTTKEAIETQMHLLQEAFEVKGVKVEAVEVTIAANGFDFMNQSNQSNQEHQSSAFFRKDRFKSMHTVNLEDEETTRSSDAPVISSLGTGTNIDIIA